MYINLKKKKNYISEPISLNYQYIPISVYPKSTRNMTLSSFLIDSYKLLTSF